jgi:hypothetical protein
MEIELLILTPFLLYFSGVYGFVNFGHRPWWNRGNFCKKAGKNLEKKLFTKEIILKKGKNLGWVKIFTHFFLRKIIYILFLYLHKNLIFTVKNEVFHVYALNKISYVNN